MISKHCTGPMGQELLTQLESVVASYLVFWTYQQMQYKTFVPLELQLGIELNIHSSDRVAKKVRDAVLKDTTGKMKNFLSSFADMKYLSPIQVILNLDFDVQKICVIMMRLSN